MKQTGINRLLDRFYIRCCKQNCGYSAKNLLIIFENPYSFELIDQLIRPVLTKIKIRFEALLEKDWKHVYYQFLDERMKKQLTQDGTYLCMIDHFVFQLGIGCCFFYNSSTHSHGWRL